MGFYEYQQQFGGKQVYALEADEPLRDPAAFVPRLSSGYDSPIGFAELFAQLLADPNADQLTALVIGTWFTDDPYETTAAVVVDSLVAAADQLGSLRAIFLGDILGEECEVSWIQQTDVSPLWEAFPKLEVFQARGGEGLSLGKFELDYLQTLVVECGGLPGNVLKELASSRVPSLTHLELYLGDNYYGWDSSVDEVQPLLSGELFPKLEYLGLRNSEIADEIAAAVASSPLLERMKELDLSRGTLGNAGAEALLKSPAVSRLKRLNLAESYLSAEMVSRLEALPIEVDLTDCHGDADPDDRYVAVSE